MSEERCVCGHYIAAHWTGGCAYKVGFGRHARMCPCLLTPEQAQEGKVQG